MAGGQAKGIRLTVDKHVPFRRASTRPRRYPTCALGAPLSSPLVPSSYTFDIEKEDGIRLSVLLEELPAGDQPHVALHLGTLYETLRRSTVEQATNDLAERLEAYATTLRRIAALLPAPLENP